MPTIARSLAAITILSLLTACAEPTAPIVRPVRPHAAMYCDDDSAAGCYNDDSPRSRSMPFTVRTSRRSAGRR
jgi:hypothetical protein